MFIKTYGSIFLYLFTATCCSIFILKKIYIKKVYGVNVLYSLLFLIATLFGIVLIFGVSIISEPIRAFSFAIVLSTILCGIVFSDIFENNESKKIKEIILIIMVVIICSTSIIGIFNLYESPLRGLPGSHMTLMNSNGLDWFLENDNNSIPLTINTKSIYKYELYYLQFNNERFEKTLLTTKKIPTHFGYETNKTLSNSLDLNETYIITSENIEQFPLAVLKSERYKYPEYLNSDFDLLNNDKSVSKYYMNGEFEIWKI
ncbi:MULTISPECIES: hypothetical protein [unclassified Methanosarcina]|uniref:hypothetical protein n=1 Tax=unclassified Methanosarcina TaxID=2644672 RepID=UPI0012E032C0|nr:MULTISPECIES: hypothetical protein [unclassified Methanosarcina]